MSDASLAYVDGPETQQTLLANDTVMGGLRLMQGARARVMRVLDVRGGQMLGAVTEDELYRLWWLAPLARLGDVLQSRTEFLQQCMHRALLQR